MNAHFPSVRSAPFPDESGRGYLLRCCELNGWFDLRRFQKAAGVTLGQICRQDDLPLVADKLGVSLEALASIASLQMRVGVEIRGQLLPQSMVRMSHRCVCLRCLSEARYLRFWFDLADVTVCPKHHTMLEHRCQCGRALTWKDPSLDLCEECGGNLCRLAFDQTGEAEMPFQKWLVEKLSGGSPDTAGLLDDLPLLVAIQFLEMVRLMLAGPLGAFQMRPAPEEDDVLAREASFAAVTHGHLPSLLVRQAEAYRRRTGRAAPKRPLQILEGFEEFIGRKVMGRGYAIENIIIEALPNALGFPVPRLDGVDYVSAQELAWHMRLTVGQLVDLLMTGNQLDKCIGGAPSLFVPNNIGDQLQRDAASR